jgi:amidase
MPDIAFRSATELIAALEAKEVSSRELLEHYLERIEALNPGLNAVVATDVERAKEDAAQADQGRATGRSPGPLAGLPMTIKDSIETEGLVTTSGAPELKEHIPQRDADAVAMLRAAGAVIVGKTNLPMYAGDIQTFNDVYGTTNNPWDVTRTPGGSS